MIPVIMLILFLSALAPFVYATHESGVDSSKIEADGSANSLHEDFHRNNLIRRAFVALGCAAFFSGLLVFCGFRWWFLFPYLAYFGASFGFTFTKSLNHSRRLPAFYVSADSRAAVTDQLITRLAQNLGIPPERFAAILYTGFLVAGILVFGAAIFRNVWIIHEANNG